ncbi:MAG: trigger factor [Syntrophaceae bacterium]|nr:trigger factor [Syntrophaceae bacterium]
MSQMSFKMEDLSPVKKKLSFEVPWEEVKTELDSVYRDISKKAKIKGFRQGKIPRNVLESYFKENAHTETINNLVNKYYWQALDENKIVALSRPEISEEEIKENAVFSFSASFETEPVFEPQGYTAMEVEKEQIIVTESDIQKKLEEIRQMFATMEEVAEERKVQNGDFAVIDFTGSFEGEKPAEMKADNYLLEIGSQRFIPGFEEQLIGMNKGEEKTIKVTFPEDYQEQKYAGKEVSFDVAMKGLKEKKLPALDENFVKNFDKYNSLEEMKADLTKSLEEEAKRLSETNLRNKITEKLLQVNEFEAPSSLVERQIYYMMADMRRRMSSAGMDDKSATELCLNMHDQFKDEAAKEVKSFLLLKKIAEKENIIVENTDADEHIRQLASKYQKDYELIRKAYEDEEKMENLKLELKQKKVFDFIVQNANIKDIEKQGLLEAEVKK